MAIYVNFEIPKTPKEFLEELFTYTYMNSVYSVQTYSDKELTTIQCPEKKYRSFDDLLELVNTYYEVSEKELLHLLLIIDVKGDNEEQKVPWFVNCWDIRKPTLNYFHEYHNHPNVDIFKEGIKDNMYNSKYDWYELFQLLELNNQQELEEYVKEHKYK